VTPYTKAIAGTQARTTDYEYDLAGKPTKTTYPDGFYTTDTYHPGTGLLNKVTGSDAVEYAAITGYEPSGKIGMISLGNGTSTTYTHDPSSTRLTAIATRNRNGQVTIQNRSYGYSPAGDIEEIGDLLNNVTYTYTYDRLHRLLGESNTGGYDAVSYTYNAIGNIVSRTVGSRTYAYAYDTGHKHAVKTITVNGTPYTYNYDANGNMVYGPDFTDPGQIGTRWPITYNADNMPTQVVHIKAGNTVTTDFLYDGKGARVKKAVQGGGTTYYIGEHYEVKDATATKYIFAGNLRIAKVTAAGTWYFHKDHLGSSTAITDETGIAVVESTEYMPFGSIRLHTGSVVSDYKYTDQEQDSETGLYFYGARYYDPVIGRFISADTVVQNFSDPQALDRYAYARNSPLSYVDPNGHFAFMPVIIGAIIGGLTAAAQGGDLGDIIRGTIIGSISAAAFYGAGEAISAINSYLATAGLELTSAAQAGIHAAAGAAAGGINSAITGGDIGRGAVVGGISGGIAKFAGTELFGQGKLFSDGFGYQLVGRSVIGGVTGGIAAGIYGGDFGQGFGYGAWTAAFGYLFNEGAHSGLLSKIYAYWKERYDWNYRLAEMNRGHNLLDDYVTPIPPGEISRQIDPRLGLMIDFLTFADKAALVSAGFMGATVDTLPFAVDMTHRAAGEALMKYERAIESYAIRKAFEP
jgi:RHS repeat-associated protein